MLHWFEHSQVFHPARMMIATGAELNRPFEDVWFEAADGIALNAWFYPANSGSPRAHWALLVCHGNAGNISNRLEICSALLQTGASILMFDYRGYGQSKGRPSETGTYLDAEAAYDFLLRRNFASANIVAYGESLGGAIATELAMRRPLGGLILESTFSCTADVGAELFPWLPVRWLNTIKYDTCSKLPLLKLPVLVLHSRGDGLISFQHAEKNFSLANEPKMFCELQGAHSEPLTDRRKFLSEMEKFLQVAEARSKRGK
jgi:fermentation-respiration switch protein FrsA (DUF1100 family)